MGLAAAVTQLGARTTLYASSRDLALAASKRFQGYRRAGDTTDGVLIVPRVDSIDVSDLETDFLGHSYVGDNRSVLTDLIELVRRDLPPAERPGLRVVGQAPQMYWRFLR
jgi:esterase/lipase superfamily enzyme